VAPKAVDVSTAIVVLDASVHQVTQAKGALQLLWQPLIWQGLPRCCLYSAESTTVPLKMLRGEVASRARMHANATNRAHAPTRARMHANASRMGAAARARMHANATNRAHAPTRARMHANASRVGAAARATKHKVRVFYRGWLLKMRIWIVSYVFWMTVAFLSNRRLSRERKRVLDHYFLSS
jgi:hypothetical protein